MPNLERRYRETDSEWVKTELEKFMVARPCPTCGGARLKPEALSVTVDGAEHLRRSRSKSVTDALRWAEVLPNRLSERERQIARQVLKEIRARLGFLVDVGLDYLTVDRTSSTLSGGEAQRIRLATQIGSSLMGVLYILDEPTIGLHQKDNAKLIATLVRLRDLGNTLIVVEHDEETIRTADWVLDIGPGAGEHGGEVIATGPLSSRPRGAALDHRRLPARRARRADPGGAAQGQAARRWSCAARARTTSRTSTSPSRSGTMTAVTGVSGSGKSTLVTEILYPRPGRARSTTRARSRASTTRSRAWPRVDKVIEIDQSPIGRTPRSNPATYVGLFTPIRELFAGVPEARMRGYGPAASRSTSRAAAARTARATGSSRSRCSSCRTSTCRARCAAASATTARRSRSTTRAARSPTSST